MVGKQTNERFQRLMKPSLNRDKKPIERLSQFDKTEYEALPTVKIVNRKVKRSPSDIKVEDPTYFYNRAYRTSETRNSNLELKRRSHIQEYGSILEELLKVLLGNERYPDQDIPRAIDIYFERYSVPFLEGKTPNLYYYVKEAKDISSFIWDIKKINSAWIAVKHGNPEQETELTSEELCYRYLLEFISYVSDTEISVEYKSAYGCRAFPATSRQRFEANETESYELDGSEEVRSQLENEEGEAENSEDVKGCFGLVRQDALRVNEILPIIFCIHSTLSNDSGFLEKIRGYLNDKFSEFRWHNIVHWASVEMTPDGLFVGAFGRVGEVELSEGVCLPAPPLRTIDDVLQIGVGLICDYSIRISEAYNCNIRHPKMILITDCPKSDYHMIYDKVKDMVKNVSVFDDRFVVYGFSTLEYGVDISTCYIDLQDALSKVKEDLIYDYECVARDAVQNQLHDTLLTF